MTSVYGVTYVGAREQIKRRLEEKGIISDDRLLFRAACYAAKVSNLLITDLFLYGEMTVVIFLIEFLSCVIRI